MTKVNYALIMFLVSLISVYPVESDQTKPQQPMTQSLKQKFSSFFSKPKTWLIVGGVALGTLLFVGAGYASYRYGQREQQIQNVKKPKFKERPLKQLAARTVEKREAKKDTILDLPVEIQMLAFEELISSAKTEGELNELIAPFEGTVSDWYNIVHSDIGRTIIRKKLIEIRKKELQKLIDKYFTRIRFDVIHGDISQVKGQALLFKTLYDMDMGSIPVPVGSYMIDLLIDLGLNINAIDSKSGTIPLLKTLELFNDQTFAELLLSKGALVDADNQGWTPLEYYLLYRGRNAKYDVVKFFLDHGTNVLRKLSNGSNYLQFIMNFNFLKTKLDPNIRTLIEDKIKQMESKNN